MTEPTELPVVDTPTERGETHYVILTSEQGRWKESETATPARSADAAIRAYAAKMPPPDGAIGTVLVAVPLRSWKPVRVKPKIETTMVIEEL